MRLPQKSTRRRKEGPSIGNWTAVQPGRLKATRFRERTKTKSRKSYRPKQNEARDCATSILRAKIARSVPTKIPTSRATKKSDGATRRKMVFVSSPTKRFYQQNR